MFAKTEVYWLSVLDTSTYYVLYFFAVKFTGAGPSSRPFFRLLVVEILLVLSHVSTNAVLKNNIITLFCNISIFLPISEAIAVILGQSELAERVRHANESGRSPEIRTLKPNSIVDEARLGPRQRALGETMASLC